MEITREAKEALARMVFELGVGSVVKGYLSYPTVLECYSLGDINLVELLSPFVGADVCIIVMPLSEPDAAEESSERFPGVRRDVGEHPARDGSTPA